MFKLSYNNVYNLLLIKFDETNISEDMIVSLAHEVHQAIDDFDKNKNMNRLFDVRKLQFIHINMNSLQKFSAITNHYNRNYESIKIAIVTSTDLMFGEFRAHEFYGELPGIERHIFHTIEEAKQWLNQS